MDKYKNLLKKKTTWLFLPLLFILSIYWSYAFSGTDLKSEVTMEISEGSSFSSVLKKLKKNNVIDNIRFFKLYAALRGDLKNIKPGEYRFNEHSSKKSILDALTKGNVVLYKVTIPEGSNIYQVAGILNETLHVNKTGFLKAVRDKETLKKWKIKGDSLEGYLYPETYYFSKKADNGQIIRKMLETFEENYSPDITKKGLKLGLNKEQIIILASIIEKETAAPQEKEIISAVFHNRLKRGMRLQSDPTTIYGIFERYRGNLSKKDLLEKTPYNTYRIKGLPPGPIANPSIESIKAAVNPAGVHYLYFVAKNDKTHVFANTLIEHNANVEKYQLRH